MSDVIVNKVAQSGIVTFNLETLFPKEEVVAFDLKDYLFKGLILREKDFRMAMKEQDWSVFAGKRVAVFCSTDAIIPVWAYMLVATRLQAHATDVVQGDERTLLTLWYRDAIAKLDAEAYRDKRVVVKGCGALPVPPSAYAEISRLLMPVVKSLMYGEPCSTVPIYKPKMQRKRS